MAAFSTSSTLRALISMMLTLLSLALATNNFFPSLVSSSSFGLWPTAISEEIFFSFVSYTNTFLPPHAEIYNSFFDGERRQAYAALFNVSFLRIDFVFRSTVYKLLF